jgi:glutamate dehydrogenase/leucine dehydrogenase
MSLFAQVQEQIRSSYTYISDDFDDRLLDHVLTHRNIVDEQVTITRDDGSEASYQVYRCQHVDVRGPFK